MTTGTPDAFRRVLCVEDDPDIRMLLEFSLSQVGGLEVLACGSGPEALQQVQAFGPDLILLDVMLPGLSGPETLERLRQLPDVRDVPVVFLTAKALTGELEPLLACGATGVIVKPFDAMRLPSDLRLYWEHGRPHAR